MIEMRAEMEGLKYILLFAAFSLIDALTTWLGSHRGLTEANPVLAGRLSSPILFFGSFTFFTILGVAVIMFSLKLEERVSFMGYFPALFVALKALPALNNIVLLTGLSPLKFISLTTARWLLGFS